MSNPKDSPDGRLQMFIRAHQVGGCRKFSAGNDCKCALCDLDRLRDQSAELLDVLKKLELAASNREHHMGDPISLMDAKYVLSQEVKQARETIAKATGQQQP